VFAAALLLTANRLLAPIVEVEDKPLVPSTPQKARSKPIADSGSNPVRRFDGTWTRRQSTTDANNSIFDYRVTLVISGGKSAVVTTDVTASRPPGGTWNDLPEAINTAAITVTVTYRSIDFRFDGSKLTIRWGAPEFSDWGPNGLPESVRQQMAANFTKGSAATAVAVFSLQGNTLTRESIGTIPAVNYRRVR